MVLDTEPRYYVYKWYIKDTGEVFYIGKGTGKRYKTRKRENKFFMKMLENHECESEIIKNNLTEKEAFELEKELIAYYRTQNVRLTNVQDGGENPPVLRCPRTEEWKEKIRESNRNFFAEHPEYSKQRSDKMKEFLTTEKGKEFQRKSIESRNNDEFRKRQSIVCKKANQTKEYIDRQSELVKKMWESPEYREKHCGSNNPKSRAIIQFDLNGNFINEFKTITLASECTGASASKICAVAKGKRNTAGGYKWEYK